MTEKDCPVDPINPYTIFDVTTETVPNPVFVCDNMYQVRLAWIISTTSSGIEFDLVESEMTCQQDAYQPANVRSDGKLIASASRK